MYISSSTTDVRPHRSHHGWRHRGHATVVSPQSWMHINIYQAAGEDAIPLSQNGNFDCVRMLDWNGPLRSPITFHVNREKSRK